jgi:hypothetical protein
MARKPTTDTMPIEIVKHKDKRVNIPTEELRDFVADDEKSRRRSSIPAIRRSIHNWSGRGRMSRTGKT